MVDRENCMKVALINFWSFISLSSDPRKETLPFPVHKPQSTGAGDSSLASMPCVQYDSKLCLPHLRLYRAPAPSLPLPSLSCLCSARCQPPSSLSQTVAFQLLSFALVLPCPQVRPCSAHKLLMPSSLSLSKRQIPYHGLQGLTGSGQLSLWPSPHFPYFPLATLGSLMVLFKNSDIFLPQGLCTCCPFCLACSSPWYPHGSLSSPLAYCSNVPLSGRPPVTTLI